MDEGLEGSEEGIMGGLPPFSPSVDDSPDFQSRVLAICCVDFEGGGVERFISVSVSIKCYECGKPNM